MTGGFSSLLCVSALLMDFLPIEVRTAMAGVGLGLSLGEIVGRKVGDRK